MRIVLLAPFEYNHPSVRSVLTGLAGAYRRHGHEVTVAVQLGASGDKPMREGASWGELRRLGGSSSHASVNIARAFFQLLRLLRGVDGVHMHFVCRWSGWVPAYWLACALRRVRRGATFHDPAFMPLGFWKTLLWRRFLAGCRWVTVPSDFSIDGFSRVAPSIAGRIHKVPCGFDPQERPQAEGGAEPARPFVLCVASLMMRKGIDVLLMAWAGVCAEMDEVDLRLCGVDCSNGHYDGLAKRLGIASRVRFLGELQRPEIWEPLRSCTVYVQPSRAESFGIALLEAMACGRAIVAARAGAIPEIIEDGKTGLLVEPADVEGLREGLLRLLRDAELRRRLGRGALEASAHYHWDRAAQSYLDLLAGRVPVLKPSVFADADSGR
ncbi:MAG: glycosyltransferase family 4 protein [Elusimicrobia bacterium]|nr:glycosyltransferase family 4 protein [Elusimicrobiota bacterium]